MAAGGAVVELIGVKSPFLLGSVVLAGMVMAALLLHPKQAVGTSA